MPPSRLCSSGVTLAMTTPVSSNARQSLGFMIILSTRTRQGTTCSRCSFAPCVFAAAVLTKRVGVSSVQRLTTVSRTRRISRSSLTNRTWTGSISRCVASLATASAHARSCARRSATGVDAIGRNVVCPRRLRRSRDTRHLSRRQSGKMEVWTTPPTVGWWHEQTPTHPS